MTKPLLRVSGLTLEVGGKVVVEEVGFEINQQEVVVLMGANGSGKSSLTQGLLGNSEYKLVESETTHLLFEGRELRHMTSDGRARAGIFVAWQNPVVIPGVSVFNLCRASYQSMGHKIEKLVDFKHKLEILAEQVGLSKDHIGRSVGEGFSGGEKKRLEMLQLLLLKPKLAILDEMDSGLDKTGVKILAKIINEMKVETTSFIVITHNSSLLSDTSIDKTWEMKNGRLSTGI